MSDSAKDQSHPLYQRDRPLINNLMGQKNVTDLEIAELARLKIRYCGFPGARDIQQDLDAIMEQWGVSEEELFEKTRRIHDVGGIYESRGKKEEKDWN